MEDARIAISLPGHPKTKKLAKRLGEVACWHLVRLFLWTAENRSDGWLAGMTDEDIELAVDWAGDDGAFVSALRDVGFLDGIDGDYMIHDWADHNPWAIGAVARSNKARWNAIKRHHGEVEADRLVPEYAAIRNAASNATDDSGDATSTRPAMLGSNAPSPSPSPSPSPNPNPNCEQAIGAGAPTTGGEVLISDADKPPASKKTSAGANSQTSIYGVRELVADGVDEQVAKDWLVVRKAKRMPLTKTAWNDTKNEATKFGITAAEAVAMAAKNGWAGFKETYAKNANAPPGRRNNTDTHFEGIEEKFANYNGPTVSLL